MMISYLCQRPASSSQSVDRPTNADLPTISLGDQCSSCNGVLPSSGGSSSSTGCKFMTGCSSLFVGCGVSTQSTRLHELSRLAPCSFRSSAPFDEVDGALPPPPTSGFTSTTCSFIAASSAFKTGNDVTAVEPITVNELASSLAAISEFVCTSLELRLPAVALVIDCRAFLAFNSNHVKSAFNASCGDRIARKRLTDGKATLADLVSGGPEETSGTQSRDRYRRMVKTAVADGSAIVAYDDNTRCLTSLPVTHPLRIITECLKKTGATVKFLLGGLQAFHAAYPQLCSKPTEPPSAPLIFSPTTPVIELDVDSAEIAEIVPHVFIGNSRDAASRQLLEKLSITHVLNVTSNFPLHFEDDASITSKRLPANDSGCQNLKQYFEDAITFIESARSSRGRVLVHCQAGVSRSPTIVIAYLMARYNWNMMTAFQFVKSRRGIVAPNFNFMGQLLDFEQRCTDGSVRHCLREDVPTHAPGGLHVPVDSSPFSF